jgi:hypothetical protein
MTIPQRISTICLIILGIVMFSAMAEAIDRKEMGYKQSVIKAIQSKSPAQKLKVPSAFNPQKVSWNLYLPPIAARKVLP